MFSGEVENSIKVDYPNIIFTKLIHSTLIKHDGKETISQDTTNCETQLTSNSMKYDVEMHSLEHSEKDVLKDPEKSHFCKWVNYVHGKFS